MCLVASLVLLDGQYLFRMICSCWSLSLILSLFPSFHPHLSLLHILTFSPFSAFLNQSRWGRRRLTVERRVSLVVGRRLSFVFALSSSPLLLLCGSLSLCWSYFQVDGLTVGGIQRVVESQRLVSMAAEQQDRCGCLVVLIVK